MIRIATNTVMRIQHAGLLVFRLFINPDLNPPVFRIRNVLVEKTYVNVPTVTNEQKFEKSLILFGVVDLGCLSRIQTKMPGVNVLCFSLFGDTDVIKFNFFSFKNR